MSELQAEIAVLFKPQDARSSLLYNVPLNTRRVIKLYIQPKVGSSFSVEITPPQANWLRLNQCVGMVPFTVVVTIDTTGLEAVSLYKQDLIFTVHGVEIHREPIYLSTQLYDPDVLHKGPLVALLNPGKRKKNLFISVLTVLEIIRNFTIAIVFLWLSLFVLLLFILIVSMAAGG